MFSLQISLGGKTFVKSSMKTVGELIMEPDEALGVLRVVGAEYGEIYRLIIESLESEVCSFYVRSRVIEWELLVGVNRQDSEIFELIKKAIFPLHNDRLSVVYVKCKKTYVIKPSAEWLTRDLRLAGVIK